ncbi:MAG TPA: tyrosine-type recombinase/integrase [Planctomicrobium sp.]|nr:tyrosine-type recombinase/integrase [Planctomicrobium sp.]
MSRRLKFTMAGLAKLKPESSRYYVYDSSPGTVSGLCLCVTETGRKTYYLYRKIDGKPVRYRLGLFPELTVETVRKIATKHSASIASGENPQQERLEKRKEWTLGQLFDWYMETHSKPHVKSHKEEQGLHDRYLKSWDAKQLSTIKRADFQLLLQQIGENHGRTAANRTISLLCNVFNVASKLEVWTGSNPASKIRKFKIKSRERFLQPDEIPKLFAAMDADQNTDIGDYVRLAVFTGARRWNLMSMEWKDIDLAAKCWNIPDTKNGESVRIALAPPCVEILERRKAATKSRYVFPARHHGAKHEHMVYPHRAWWRILKRAGLEDLRMHDLRRTLGSWQAAAGASQYVIGKSLGHKSPQATAIYARLNLDPVRESVDAAVTAMLSAAAKKEKSEEEKAGE